MLPVTESIYFLDGLDVHRLVAACLVCTAINSLIMTLSPRLVAAVSYRMDLTLEYSTGKESYSMPDDSDDKICWLTVADEDYLWWRMPS